MSRKKLFEIKLENNTSRIFVNENPKFIEQYFAKTGILMIPYGEFGNWYNKRMNKMPKNLKITNFLKKPHFRQEREEQV